MGQREAESTGGMGQCEKQKGEGLKVKRQVECDSKHETQKGEGLEVKGQVEWDSKYKHKKIDGLEVKGQVEWDKCKKNKAVSSIIECTVAWFSYNIFLDFCR